MILFKNTLETVWVLCRQPFYKRDLSTRAVECGILEDLPGIHGPQGKKGTNVSDIVTQQEPSRPKAVFSSMLYGPGEGERYILDQCKFGIFSSRCIRLRGTEVALHWQQPPRRETSD